MNQDDISIVLDTTETKMQEYYIDGVETIYLNTFTYECDRSL